MNKKRIAAKPQSNKKKAQPSLDDIINQGSDFPKNHSSSSARSKEPEIQSSFPKKRPRIPKTKILLSITESLLSEVDEHLLASEYPGHRSTWIQSAIKAQLEKERKE